MIKIIHCTINDHIKYPFIDSELFAKILPSILLGHASKLSFTLNTRSPTTHSIWHHRGGGSARVRPAHGPGEPRGQRAVAHRGHRRVRRHPQPGTAHRHQQAQARWRHTGATLMISQVARFACTVVFVRLAQVSTRYRFCLLLASVM